jgi:Protein of unknown function (DUF1552).
MIISKRVIPRRTALRGLGSMLALPLLDSMVPALSAFQKTAAKPINRFGVMYVPNGMIMKNYLPSIEGSRLRADAHVERPRTVSRAGARAERAGVHSPTRAARRGPCESEHALSDRRLAADERNMARCRHLDGSDPGAGDRQADAAGVARACDRVRRDSRRLRHRVRLSVYEHDQLEEPEHAVADAEQPRVVFERLFGDSTSTDPKARLARLQQQRSVLDSVSEEVAHLRGALPQSDRTKLTEYLDAIRNVSSAFRLPSSRAIVNCRWSIIPPAFQPAGKIT